MGLDDVTNVGPATADTLDTEGYESVTDLASADPDDLADVVSRWSTDQADETIESATELSDLRSDDQDEESSEDTVTNPETIVEGIEEDSSDESEEPAVTFETEVKQANHLLHAVLGEATDRQRSGQREMARSAYRTADYIRASLPGDTTDLSDNVTITFPQDENVLATLSRTCSQKYREYQGASGRVGGMMSAFNLLGDEVDDARY